MKLIDVYPKFTKYALWVLFSLFGIALLICIISHEFGFPRNSVNNAADVIAFVLFFPLALNAGYLFNSIENEANKLHFVDDEELKRKVTPLLQGIDSSVRIGRYASDCVNAFTISSIFGKKSLIGFSSALTSKATDDQLLAIAAHEVAHLKSGDSENKMYMLAFHKVLQVYPHVFSEISKYLLKSLLAISVFVIIIFGILLGIAGGTTPAIDFVKGILWMIVNVGWRPAIAIAVFITLDYVLKRIFFSYSRKREFAADAAGAAMTSPSMMVSGLNLLTDSEAAISVFDTHPPLEERKKRLLNLQELGSRLLA